MSPAPQVLHLALRGSWMPSVVGFAGGLAFTGAIAASLALFSRQATPEVEPTIVSIGSIDVPDPPPPPPEQRGDAEAVSLTPTPLAFESAPSPGGLRLQALPMPIDTLARELQTTAEPRFDFSPGLFKPGTEAWKPGVDHIFQPAEVDQRAVVIYRKIPEISTYMLEQVATPRVRLLLVVNADGSVEDVRVLRGAHPEFDKRIIEAVAQWRFRPAVRAGRKVRCLAELPVFVRAPRRDPFSVN